MMAPILRRLRSLLSASSISLGTFAATSFVALAACGKIATDDSNEAVGGSGSGSQSGGSQSGGSQSGGGGNSPIVIGDYTCEDLWSLGLLIEYNNYCDDGEEQQPDPNMPALPTEEEARELLREGWGESLELPEDTRPAAPEWNPPFQVGEPGWKSSTEPFCQPFELPPDLTGLWVDERGAFASVARHCGFALEAERCDEVSGGVLYQNAGDGWKVVATPAVRIPRMNAFSNGTFLFGTQTLYSLETGATIIEDPTFGASQVEVHALHESALLSKSEFELEAGTTFTLYRLFNDQWALQALEGDWFDATLAADGTVILSGEGGLAAFDGETTRAIGGVPAGTYLSLWANTADDLFAVNQVGQMLYSGGEFEVIHEFGEEVRVTFRRGGENLFFITDLVFGVIRDNRAEVLLEMPRGRLVITQLAADQEGNAYLSLIDKDLRKYRCGEHVMLWYDGTEFHRF